jgi:hypothetical protein
MPTLYAAQRWSTIKARNLVTVKPLQYIIKITMIVTGYCIGALHSGLVKISSSGLWSLLTRICFAETYWLNLTQENTIANVSFSI